MYIIGIDPGISGSNLFFWGWKNYWCNWNAYNVRRKKNKKQVNGNQLFNEIKSRLNYVIKSLHLLL